MNKISRLRAASRQCACRAARRAPKAVRRLSQGLALLLAGTAVGVSAQVLEISDRDGAAAATPVASFGSPCQPSCAPADSQLSQDIPNGAITEVTVSDVPQTWRAPLMAAATAARISPSLLAALVHQESGWRSGARSGKGAIGLAQLMPGTARQMGVDPHDPESNLIGGARYLRNMLDRFDGNVALALAAYNAGPARVLREHAVPAITETKAYVNQVFDRLTALRPVTIQGVLP